MSNDNKELNNNELCEEKKELTREELEQVNGGGIHYIDPDNRLQAIAR